MLPVPGPVAVADEVLVVDAGSWNNLTLTGPTNVYPSCVLLLAFRALTMVFTVAVDDCCTTMSKSTTTLPFDNLLTSTCLKPDSCSRKKVPTFEVKLLVKFLYSAELVSL